MPSLGESYRLKIGCSKNLNLKKFNKYWLTKQGIGVVAKSNGSEMYAKLERKCFILYISDDFIW